MLLKGITVGLIRGTGAANISETLVAIHIAEAKRALSMKQVSTNCLVQAVGLERTRTHRTYKFCIIGSVLETAYIVYISGTRALTGKHAFTYGRIKG
jgi:hypothetical protein